MSAQEFIIILVTAAFMRCLRMAVEHRDTEIIKTVLVGKFAAVVAGNGQKQFIEVSAEFLLQSLHGFGSAGRGLIGHFQHNFLSGHSFRNDKAGFFFAFTTTDYTVNFPVTEGIPEVYIFRTLFNTAVQGVSCTDRLFVCLYGIFSLFGMSDRQMTAKEYCTSHDAIAYYSGLSGLEIHGIEYGVDDYHLTTAVYKVKNG